MPLGHPVPARWPTPGSSAVAADGSHLQSFLEACPWLVEPACRDVPQGDPLPRSPTSTVAHSLGLSQGRRSKSSASGQVKLCGGTNSPELSEGSGQTSWAATAFPSFFLFPVLPSSLILVSPKTTPSVPHFPWSSPHRLCLQGNDPGQGCSSTGETGEKSIV